MSFIRPTLRRQLWRWREPIIYGALSAVSLWFAVGYLINGAWIFGPLFLVGFGLFGFATLVATQRILVTGADGSPGVVVIEERRIGYLGPFEGSFVDLDDVKSIEIVTTDGGPWQPDSFWVLDTGQQRLSFPTGAKGADGLFETFSALPGMKWERVIDAMASTSDARFEIWRRA